MAIAGVDISHELTNIPIGDMITALAQGIADAQWELDQNSMATMELMSGTRMLRDIGAGELLSAEGVPSTDLAQVPVLVDSRVYFGFEYKEQDGALTRVPSRVSMMELGFTPTFYQFVDTILEVKIDISLSGGTESRVANRGETKRKTVDRTEVTERVDSHHWFGGGGCSVSRRNSKNVQVRSTPVDAEKASKYSYSAEGSSLLRTKLVPVPPPPMLEERIRLVMEQEEQWRQKLKSREGTFEQGLGGLHFNGHDTDVGLPTMQELTISQADSFTVEAWVRVDAFDGGDEAILGNVVGQGRSRQLHLCLRQRRPYMGFLGNDTWGGSVLLPDVWYHLAFVYDKAAEGGTQSIYLNGVLDGQRTKRDSFLGVTNQLVIGRWGNHRFNGFLDEVRVWKGARTQDQIKGGMKRHLTRAVWEAEKLIDKLVGVWRLNTSSRDAVLRNVDHDRPVLDRTINSDKISSEEEDKFCGVVNGKAYFVSNIE